MSMLSEIQVGLKVKKLNENKFGGYVYRKAEDILEAVKPLLKEYECHLIIIDDLVLIGDRYYVKATATLYQESKVIGVGIGFAREALEQKGMNVSQITGSASSYSRKYSLNGLFAIDDTEDDDSMNEIEMVSDEQIANIETLASEVNADMAGFMKYLKVKDLAELTVDNYPKAIKALESKRAKQ